MDKIEKIKEMFVGIDFNDWSKEEVTETAKAILELLDDNWIPVTHKLRPPKGVSYIVLTANGHYMSIASRELDDWLIQKYQITHWMIPSPPRKNG